MAIVQLSWKSLAIAKRIVQCVNGPAEALSPLTGLTADESRRDATHQDVNWRRLRPVPRI